jgi:hypothetical protein
VGHSSKGARGLKRGGRGNGGRGRVAGEARGEPLQAPAGGSAHRHSRGKGGPGGRGSRPIHIRLPSLSNRSGWGGDRGLRAQAA